jgi:hypothetical protein
MLILHFHITFPYHLAFPTKKKTPQNQKARNEKEKGKKNANAKHIITQFFPIPEPL